MKYAENININSPSIAVNIDGLIVLIVMSFEKTTALIIGHTCAILAEIDILARRTFTAWRAIT